MWTSALPDDARGRREQEQGPENPWHNFNNAEEHEQRSPNDDVIESPESPQSPSSEKDCDGTWGERDTGIRSRADALQEYDILRHELTELRKTQSRARSRSLRRITTNRSTQSARTEKSRRSTRMEEPEDDVEDTEEEEEGFELDQFMKEGHFEKRVEGRSAKKVGVIWKSLTVKGIGSTSTTVRTVPDAVIGSFGPDLYRIITHFIPALRFSRHVQTRTLIHDFTGVLRDGEMMLVLGRPGSGCSTFLKAISNNRESYAAVEGEVSYGGISAERQKRLFRGEVNYNPEDDKHFAALNVWQTLKFSLMNKTKKREKDEIPIIINALLRMFGISHTKYTLVGDEYIRGVSGGERKRVSIAETLASKSTVVCWDNSTRGLDSSTALDYAKSLRIMTDISNRTTLVTLYQAGEGIYRQMDKVLVIDEGRCIFQGPAEDAKQYFIDLGFLCPERQTTADFLTAVTDPGERRFREGYESKVPKTPEDLERAFRASPNYQRVLQGVQAYEQELHDTDFADAKQFERTIQEQKSNKTVAKSSNYTVSFPRQVLACTRREFWLIFGDTTTLYTKFWIIISNSLIVGSLFWGQPLNTDGAFSRGGAAFFAIVFLGWLQLTELMKAVSGRAVVERHKDYAFYRPSAVAIARVVTDFPILLAQVVPFCIAFYFMAGFDVDVSKFWIFLLFVYTITICITALYRMFAALSPSIDDAVRFSGIGLNLLVIFTGYVIPKPQLVDKYIWFGWLSYVNPIGYAFEGVLSSEFGDRTMECSSLDLVPQGPNANPANQGCALSGSSLNARTVSGSAYLQATYTYSRTHLWRNFGIMIAFTLFYIAVTVIATELVSFVEAGSGALVFKNSRRTKKILQQKSTDEEKVVPENPNTSSKSSSNTANDAFDADKKGRQEETLQKLSMSDSIFTWRDVEYTVPYRGGERKLLNKVSGYAMPGKMVALVGASGAGKTTLLNTLSQRQTVGVLSGEMLVDGKPLGPDFQRSTGFCEQMDLHDGTATIREALEFSAMLRQNAEVPTKEKIEYVDRIIDLLELGDIQNAIISSLGVEQRKRLTIGVELAAKPSLLLFLDEPTSGLDSNSAYSIVRFLKKLAAAGQAIVCTIHQPSSILIQQFDMILALNPGGNVFYFGPVGENGKDVIKYFGDRGVHCPPNRNVAEFILETAIKGGKRVNGKKLNWTEEWRNSQEQRGVLAEIDHVHRTRKELTRNDTTNAAQLREFAAPMWLQTALLTQRVFRQHWRDPSYYYGKLFISVIQGIFNGFTFYMLGSTVQDMQNRMFSCFLIIMTPPLIVNSTLPRFWTCMKLWQARELPSRIYGWIPFTTAMVVSEIPAAIVGAVVYFLLWYYPVGLPRDSATAGYVFLMTVVFFFFQASWGQWIGAFAPSFTVISNILPFFFVMFSLFNGVVRPYVMLPNFWKFWMYYINPATWWVGGVLAATLHGQPVECADAEFAKFTAPAGESCQSYAGGYVQQVGGYVQELAGGVCGFCRYRNGDEYMAILNVQPSDKWRNFGIFMAFVVSNWALVYFFVWSVRIKGWSFGFGKLSALLGKGANLIKRGLKGRKNM
ncbi:putative ABC transporter [Rhizodiscina lignyota]|uniref:ABC multidrug transporter atrF n=1 Tax=Rhizodiscina lignyota TaxID=1504668 RepID=A0A9P4MB44_9PEZI|nr:putative ABC transporter [Rhizodiscina lignyota]